MTHADTMKLGKPPGLFNAFIAVAGSAATIPITSNVIPHVNTVWQIIIFGCVAICTLLASHITKQALRKSALADHAPDLTDGEENLLAITTTIAVITAWNISLSITQSAADLRLVAAAAAAVGAATAVLIVTDDLRHQSFNLEPGALCLGAAVIWSYASGDKYHGAGEVAVLAVLGAVAIASINLAASLVTSDPPFGNGEWMIIAIAAAWLHGTLLQWVIMGSITMTITGAFHLAANGNRSPLGPGIAAGVIVAWVFSWSFS